jgi:hypothetical protein
VQDVSADGPDKSAVPTHKRLERALIVPGGELLQQEGIVLV